MIRTSCPKCGREDAVADYLAALPILCKSCGTRVTTGDRIPERAPVLPPPPPPRAAPPPPPPPPIQAAPPPVVPPPPPPPKPPKVKPPKPAKAAIPKRGAEPRPAAPAVEADTPDPQHPPGMNGLPRMAAEPAEVAVEAEPQPAPQVAAPVPEPQPLPQWAVRPTPAQEKPFPLPLASIGRRILARILFLIGLVLMAGLGLAITVFAKPIARDLPMQVMIVVTMPAIYLLANAAMLARTGQDVGKRYAGVKVVSDDGSPATPGAALLKRDVLTLLIGLTGVGLLYWLMDLVTLFTRRGHCLHDRIAKTRVVRAS